MITKLVTMFIVLLISVCLGVQLYHDPGYLFIAINQWSIETTLGVALPCLALIFLLIHTALNFFHWIIHIPKAWKAWRAKLRAQDAQKKTKKGLIEFSEGHWLQAKKHLINALPNTEAPLLNYLTAARAAQEMGDSKLRDDYLREAQQSMPDAKIAVELTQAQLQLANKQWEQALATLRHLQDLSPHHPYVLKLLMRLYVEVKDWPQLIQLLPILKQHKIVADLDIHQLEKTAWLQSMIEAAKSIQITNLENLYTNLPKTLKQDPDILHIYVSYLLESGDHEQAERLIRNTLKKTFNEELIILYSHVKNIEPKFEFVDSLLKANPHSAGIYLCLGRINQAKQLWGKARVYFEESIRLKPSAEAYSDLGDLLVQLGDEAGACNAYRKGLRLRSR